MTKSIIADKSGQWFVRKPEVEMKKVIIADKSGQWFVRKPELWGQPTEFEHDADQAKDVLGEIALNRKFCPTIAPDAETFDNESEANAFIKKHFVDNDNLRLAYTRGDKHLWSWNRYFKDEIDQMPDFYISRSMYKRYQNELINDDWKHCFVCGKPSDGEASQWHDVPLCADENGMKCLREFEKMLKKHEIERLNLDTNPGVATRIKPIMMNVRPLINNVAAYDNWILEQGDIVTGTRDSTGDMPEYIVVEHVEINDLRQDYLALKNMKTNEVESLIEIFGKLDFLRKATDEEIEKYNVWL